MVQFLTLLLYRRMNDVLGCISLLNAWIDTKS